MFDVKVVEPVYVNGKAKEFKTIAVRSIEIADRAASDFELNLMTHEQLKNDKNIYRKAAYYRHHKHLYNEEALPMPKRKRKGFYSNMSKDERSKQEPRVLG